MAGQKIERAPQAAQHAEREHIDLHQPECVDVVLVPFDEGAIVHGGIADRHRFVEPFAGEHKAADMLGEMARKADQIVGKLDGLPDGRIGGIEPGLADVIVRQAVAIAPHGLGERRGHVRRQPQNLADFADRTAGAIVNDGRADRRAVASITFDRYIGSLPRAVRARSRHRCRAARRDSLK